jgi:cytochrome c553
MSRRLHWGFLLASSLWVGMMTMDRTASAADAKLGKAKSQPCSVCHGATGMSTLPDAPNLAGQPEIYLSNQLRSYRSGERRHEVMSLVAKALSDDDIANLAAWFSSIRIEAKPPE